DDGGEVFVHSSALPPNAVLRPGQRVEFGIAEGRRGAQALQVRILEQSPTVTTRSDQPSAQRNQPLPEWNQPLAKPPVPSSVALKRPTVARVVEAPTRRFEAIGDEPRLFNNAKSSSTSVETIRVSYTARVSASVDLGKTRTLSGNASVGFADIVK